MQEIILINKPKGITSFDVIRILRKKLGIKKIGHAGTLDPLASGLMIIGVGNGTKKLSEYIKLDKVYDAEILLGIKTETGDMEGSVVHEEEIKKIDENKVRNVIEEMRGVLILPVPRFSAKKVGGKKLYEMARKKQDFQTPLKEMYVFDTKFIGIEKKDKYFIVRTSFHVGSGTYLRSIAEEIGNRLGVPSTLYSLVRTKIGEFRIENSIEIEKD